MPLQRRVNTVPSHNAEWLSHLLANYSGEGWLRGVNYHESIAGDLDRWQLDMLVNDRPARIQHRSGKLWVLNSLAVEKLDLAAHKDLPGIELNATGVPTGQTVPFGCLVAPTVGPARSYRCFCAVTADG